MPSDCDASNSGALDAVSTAAAVDAVVASDSGSVTFTSRPLASAPAYRGSLDDSSDCSSPYATLGFEPVDAPGTRHPLFLYFVGTTFVAGDQSSQYDSQAARAATEAMARRGFVALSAQYDNGALAWLSDHENQLDCLFATSQPGSLLLAACNLPQVDCDLGIATWGHSQGAYVAVSAASYDPRVRAAWATGYGGDAAAGIAQNRLRVVNGEADTSNGTVAVLNPIAGFSPSECPDDGRNHCLRSDGSGWIIVQRKDVVLSSADHCWFDKKSCADDAETLEPNWIDSTSTKAFALEGNADWVAQTARRR